MAHCCQQVLSHFPVLLQDFKEAKTNENMPAITDGNEVKLLKQPKMQNSKRRKLELHPQQTPNSIAQYEFVGTHIAQSRMGAAEHNLRYFYSQLVHDALSYNLEAGNPTNGGTALLGIALITSGTVSPCNPILQHMMTQVTNASEDFIQLNQR